MALKKVSELNKAEKLLLLKSIAAGDVDKNTLDKNTLVACEYKDYFQGLIVAANQIDGEAVNVICLGESRKAKSECIEDIEIVGLPGGEVLLTLKRRSPNVI